MRTSFPLHSSGRPKYTKRIIKRCTLNVRAGTVKRFVHGTYRPLVRYSVPLSIRRTLTSFTTRGLPKHVLRIIQPTSPLTMQFACLIAEQKLPSTRGCGGEEKWRWMMLTKRLASGQKPRADNRQQEISTTMVSSQLLIILSSFTLT